MATRATEPSPPRRNPPSRRVLLALVVPIIICSTAGTLGSAFFPTLATRHPLLLISLDARNRQLLLASHRVGLLAFLVVATMRKFASDPFFYGFGRLYGDSALGWLDRKGGGAGTSVRTVERLFKRASIPLVAIWSGSVVCTLAGATEMNPLTFVTVDIAGSVLEIYGIWAIAGHFRGVLTDVTTFIGANQWWLTVVTASLAAVALLWQWRFGGGAVGMLSSLSAAEPSELE